jgi:peroxiredoxin
MRRVGAAIMLVAVGAAVFVIEVQLRRERARILAPARAAMAPVVKSSGVTKTTPSQSAAPSSATASNSLPSFLLTVLQSDGKPLTNAWIFAGFPPQGLRIERGKVIATGGKLAPDGTYTVPGFTPPYMLLVVGDEGFVYAGNEALDQAHTLQAKPYGRIEGRYLIGNGPGANVTLHLSGSVWDQYRRNPLIRWSGSAKTDSDGRFAFEKVIPMPEMNIARLDPVDAPRRVVSNLKDVQFTSGQTTQITIGGQGRAVIGRIEPPTGWSTPINLSDGYRCYVSLQSDRPHFRFPVQLFRDKTRVNSKEWLRWTKEWNQSPEGLAHNNRDLNITVGFLQDGAFRVDDVPAGTYRVVIRVNDDPVGHDGPFALLSRVITILPMSSGRSDEPLDLGTIRLERRTSLSVGDLAPPFEVVTIESKKISLADYQGKYVLLDFNTTTDHLSWFQIVHLNEVYEKFGAEKRVELLSLTLATDNDETRAYIAEKGESWPQAIIGPIGNPISSAYGVEEGRIVYNPVAILIGPDGRIAAKAIHPQQILPVITEVLSKE